MKPQLLAYALASIVGTSIIYLISLDVQAQTTSDKSFVFLCKVIDRIPNTVVVINETIRPSPQPISLGQRVFAPLPVTTRKISPVIPWTLPIYNESLETPLEKCTRVSAILQNIAAQKKLNFISFSRANEKNFICTVNNYNLDCYMSLFVLENEEDPVKLVNNLRWIANELSQPLPLSPLPLPSNNRSN